MDSYKSLPLFTSLIFLTVTSSSANQLSFRRNVINTGARYFEHHPNRTSFAAAVYEHAVIPALLPWYSRKMALHLMWKNLDIYDEQVSIAARKGVDIIVFPEDGVYGPLMSRKKIEPFLEYIPDPLEIDWNPCMEPQRYPDTEVQRRLSCMARDNNIYLAVNIGDRKQCNKSTDPNCPSDGRYQYNTNVVYSPRGALIARYHKQNLYAESQFNRPSIPEQIFFTTPFGRFGVFTCFDILFKSPAVDLIEMHNIDTILFPTAWRDALPLLAAIEYHSAFAVMMKVNLLAANIHFPSFRFGGSGIYTPTGEVVFYRDETSSQGRLLLATIPSNNQRVIPRSNTLQTSPVLSVADHRRDSFFTNKVCDFHSTCRKFQSIVFHDTYSFVWLKSLSGNIKVCRVAACCYLDYAMRDDFNTSRDSYFALGVFDGVHNDELPYYLEVCTLLKCANSHSDSCGEVVKQSNTYFYSISLRAEFKTSYIAPEILVMEHSTQLALIPSGWQYDHDSHTLTATNLSLPVVSVNLVGRWYSHDDNNKISPLSQIIG